MDDFYQRLEIDVDQDKEICNLETNEMIGRFINRSREFRIYQKEIPLSVYEEEKIEHYILKRVP